MLLGATFLDAYIDIADCWAALPNKLECVTRPSGGGCGNQLTAGESYARKFGLPFTKWHNRGTNQKKTSVDICIRNAILFIPHSPYG
jgi:hypothetical protein